MLLTERFKVGKIYKNTRDYSYNRTLYTDLKLSIKIGDFDSKEIILVIELFRDVDESFDQILKVLTSSGLIGVARFSYNNWNPLP